jgi:hypothetical protein
LTKKILITRPEHDDTTHYLSHWNQHSIEIAQTKGFKTFDLHRKRANRKEVEGILSKQDPDLVVLNGHGNDNVVAGHRDNPLIVNGQNEELLKGRITYAISCRSAKKLGRKSVTSGAKAYIGYEDDFIFFYDPHKVSRPLKDKTAELFLKPATEVVISLIKGSMAGEAADKSKQSFKINMRKLLSSESAEKEASMAKYLWWDMRNLVCLGDKHSRF